MSAGWGRNLRGGGGVREGGVGCWRMDTYKHSVVCLALYKI